MTIPEKCKRSSGYIDLRRLKDAQPALFKNAGSSKSSEHERKKSSDQPSKSTSSKPTSNGGHESKSKKREDNAKEKKLFGSSSDSDDSDLERMKKKVVKPSLFKPDKKSTDLTVKSKVEQPSLFKPDKKSTDPTAKPKTEQPSLFKPDSKSTDLTVKPKTEEPAVKPDLKPDKTDTKKHITESSTKKPEDTKKDLKVKSEKKEAPSGFFPPKPFSIVVEKITKSQIEKWEEDCSSAPPAPIPKIKNRPMKPVESKSPTPAPRRRFSSSSSSSSSRRSRSRKRSSSSSSRSSSRGARPAKKKLPPARKRFSSSSSSSSRSRSPPPAPKRPPVIKKPSQPPKKPEFTRPKAKAIRSDSSSDSGGSSRGRRKARSDSDSDDSPKRSKEPPKKLVKNPMMFINPFAKQEDPEEAAKAAAVKAALMEKIANIAAADTPDKKEDKKDPFKIPKRRDTTEEKKGEEKDQKHKDREAEKKREQKKEQKPESKPKGVLFDAAYLLRSSSRLRPFMNLLKIECGEGTLSFLRRKVTMSEFEAHVNRAMKNLESESPRPTKHLGNYSQKRPHGEEAQKYKLKHLTINLSDLKTSDQKNIQLLKDATPKWETYRKSYCRRRRHTLQDGIKEIKRKVEGDRERERDHREKDRHSERPPIPKIPKKPIDPRFERTSELSQSKAPLKTNSYNMGWKAATGNKGPKRFENFQEQKRWEEEQATSFDIRRLMGPLSKKNKDKKADEDDEDMPACQSFGTQAKQIQAPKEPRVNKFANTAAINNDAPMPMIVKLEPGQPDLYMHHSGESFTLPLPGMYPRDTPTDLEVPGGPWTRGPFSAGRDNEMFQGSEQRYRGSSPSRALPTPVAVNTNPLEAGVPMFGPRPGGPGPRSSRFDQPPPGFGQPPPGFGQPPPGFGQPPPGIGQPPPNPSPAVFANPYADNSDDERSATTGGGPTTSHDDSGPIIVPTYNTSSNFDDIAARYGRKLFKFFGMCFCLLLRCYFAWFKETRSCDKAMQQSLDLAENLDLEV